MRCLGLSGLVEAAFLEVMVLFFLWTKTSYTVTFKLAPQLLRILNGDFAFLLQESNNFFSLGFSVTAAEEINCLRVKMTQFIRASRCRK